MVSTRLIVQIKFSLITFYNSIVVFIEVSEVIDAIVFLLSDHSSMINGVTLPVDGGFLAT